MAVPMWFLLLALSGCSQALLTPLDPVKTAVDAALIVVQKASADAKLVTDAAVAKVQEVIVRLEGAAVEVQKKAKQDVGVILGGLQVLDQTAMQAANNTPAVRACLTISAIADLALEGVKDLAWCVTNKIQQAVTIATDLVELGVAAVGIAPSAVTDIKGCTEQPEQLLCITGAVKNATTDAISIGLRVAGNVVNATMLVTNLQADLSNCAAAQMFGFVVKTGVFTVEVGKCMIDAFVA